MFQVEQNIHGTTYVYQVTAYWDSSKKQARQKRVCIGKKDPRTGELIPSRTQIRPRGCRDYGNYHLLNSLAIQLGLRDSLKEHFPDTWQEILTCAFYEISERKPLYLCEQWSESTETVDGVTLTSQRISELLQELGKSDRERQAFFRSWAKHRAEQEYLAFDITSVSSYSKLIEFLEFGYNRDGEDLPQINLAMLFGETSLLPIFYSTSQGSIRDMSTLSNMILQAEYLEMKRTRFVMDKGFYSDANVAEMLKKHVKFAVSVPFTTLLSKRLVEKSRKSICSPGKSFILNGDIIYCEKFPFHSHNSRLSAFVYYEERQFLDSKEALLKRIMLLEQKLSGKNTIPRVMKDPCLRYLVTRHSKKGLILHRNDQAIYDALLYKGYVVILSNDRRDPYDMLCVYRAKDAIERAFDNMKNELDLKRLRVHSETAMTGRTFLCFIALILYSWLDKKMRESDLYKRFTQEEVMAQLKRLKIVELDERRKMLTEISKNQVYLFEKLDIVKPNLA
jgi:transposase